MTLKWEDTMPYAPEVERAYHSYKFAMVELQATEEEEFEKHILAYWRSGNLGAAHQSIDVNRCLSLPRERGRTNAGSEVRMAAPTAGEEGEGKKSEEENLKKIRVNSSFCENTIC